MPVYLDDEPIAIECTNLASLLQAAQARLPGGRIIVEVEVDGRSVAGEELQSEAPFDTAACEVRLASADPHDLAIDALDGVRRRLHAVKADQREAAELLQQDRGVEALQKVAGSIEGWLQAQQAVAMAAGLAEIDLERLPIGDKPAAGLFDDLIAALRGFKESLVHRDTVALADALAYEWPDLVDRWDRLVEALTERIEAA